MAEFLVVDVPYVYNVIMGRPLIHEIHGVVSMYHQTMIYVSDRGHSEKIFGYQEEARRCNHHKPSKIRRDDKDDEEKKEKDRGQFTCVCCAGYPRPNYRSDRDSSSPIKRICRRSHCFHPKHCENSSSQACLEQESTTSFERQTKSRVYVEPIAILSRNWLELPVEITMMILMKMDVVEILESAQFVCKLWYNFCKDPFMWHYCDR
ncbi:uncharacterized protein LOC110728462 [Chenopodium quinoa]|uniref:uncharacterized protein LOC110728462 n=1 Tax=Chenopodium quinoa TaxID=63459 RepID=UPI000B76E60A|nr:uncharacterized protein LOC110728462 [Chenopodium quinoa]